MPKKIQELPDLKFIQKPYLKLKKLKKPKKNALPKVEMLSPFLAVMSSVISLKYLHLIISNYI
jgi:hypothetical protein